MAITTTEAAGAHQWVARPNRSLTPTARRRLIGGVVLLSLVVSGGFALAGAWLVAPFAGLELLVLFFALRAIARHDASFESIRLEGRQLIVTRRLPDGDLTQRFHAGWARVSLDAAPGADPLLCIRAHGQGVALGRLMTPDQRRQLAADLRQRLQP